MEYPEKFGEDASAMEVMQWMEAVDRYWQTRGFQKLDHNQEEEESTDEQE